MLLIGALIKHSELNVRHVLRAQMETSGLKRILDKYAILDHPHLTRYTKMFYDDALNDESEIADNMKEDVVMNFSDPRGTFDAILANTQGRALDFLTSTLKQLLLVPHDAEGRMRYFQLIDRVVSSIVTDRKGFDGDFSSLLGSSVATIVSQFADQDRLEDALEDAADARATVARLRREREALEEEIAQKDEGLVGQLKSRVDELERNLFASRAVGETLRGELSNRQSAYKARIAALELQVRELFNMLKEAKTLESIRDDGGVLDRRELMDLMEKKIQRTKAIQRLEGTSGSGLQVEDAYEGSGQPPSSPRKSRFEDAPDEEVRNHIEDSLTYGTGILVSLLVSLWDSFPSLADREFSGRPSVDFATKHSHPGSSTKSCPRFLLLPHPRQRHYSPAYPAIRLPLRVVRDSRPSLTRVALDRQPPTATDDGRGDQGKGRKDREQSSSTAGKPRSERAEQRRAGRAPEQTDEFRRECLHRRNRLNGGDFHRRRL